MDLARQSYLFKPDGKRWQAFKEAFDHYKQLLEKKQS
jgi:hypothetical protein